jgi:hypothetical protein
MANVAKYTKTATRALCDHYERAKGACGEYILFGNQDIDTEKTHLNYNLALDQNQLEFIKQRTSEVKCLKRDDVNVMCSWVITLPQGIEQQKEFFEESYKFLAKVF